MKQNMYYVYDTVIKHVTLTHCLIYSEDYNTSRFIHSLVLANQLNSTTASRQSRQRQPITSLF